MSNKLYIPYGIKIEKDLFMGFGKREAKHFLIGLAVTGIISLIAYLVTQNAFNTIACIVVGAAGSYFASRRETYSQSIVGVMQGVINFYRTQQKFNYVYGQMLTINKEGLQCQVPLPTPPRHHGRQHEQQPQ